MELITFYIETWAKALISIGILIFVFYVLFVCYSITSLFRFQKLLNSYEISIKMAIVETITLIRSLAKITDYELDEDIVDKLDSIETSVSNGILKGFYKQVSIIYLTINNESKIKDLTNEQKYKVDINFKQYQEIDKLYQKGLFYHNTDLVGYNYWVKFILTKPFTLMFKFKKRESIY